MLWLAFAWGLTHAAVPAVPQDQPEKFDIAANKENLRVLTDGKKHYYVYDVKGSISGPAFYGDGKTFYQLRIAGGGASGDKELSHSLWDPRIEYGRNGYAAMRKKDDAYTIDCPPRTAQLTAMSDAEAKAVVDGATFYKPRWNRMAYKLARDEKGTYYFVDHLRDAKRDFHLWVGPRGAMKQQQMTNIVSDSVGDIFATKSGELRLVLNDNKRGKGEEKDPVLKWVSGKSETPLTEVPVEENVSLIYNELGPYEGQKLGTPCDDF